MRMRGSLRDEKWLHGTSGRVDSASSIRIQFVTNNFSSLYSLAAET